MMKDFKQEFNNFLTMIKNEENFAFSRFSDGELYMMQNRRVTIEPNQVFLREQLHAGSWGPEELKDFNPDTDEFYKDKLIQCFQHEQENYFKGICFSEDIGTRDYQWQWGLIEDHDTKFITWSNLLINGNYADFIEKMVPLFMNKKIIYVCNKLANIDNLPFEVKKDFRIGQNCQVNNYGLIEEMKAWIKNNNIKNHVFLFSAATLSNYLIYELYKQFPNNTYLDIGSTLNPIMGLHGWKGSRFYLREYWLGEPSRYTNLIGKWG